MLDQLGLPESELCGSSTTRAKAQKGIIMKYIALKQQITRRIMLVACTTALAVGLMVSLPQLAQAQSVTPPTVPDNKLQVEAGNEAFLVGHAVGTQNYVCKPSGTGVKFVLFTPEATLFKDGANRQIITHYFSPNPFEPNTDATVVADGLIRATWQSRDSSTVWAKVHQPDGSLTVDQSAIAWLLLDVVGAQDGPTGGHTLSDTTFIQRVNTTGGLPPATGCISSTDVGNQAFVPYTADYFFYRKQPGNN
jgi:hypothetical protein